MTEKANRVRVVISKGLNSHTPTGKYQAPGILIVEPKYFISPTKEERGNHRLV